jgi:hypothetical protein
MARRAALAAVCALALSLPSPALAGTSAAGHVRYAIDSAAQFSSDTAARHKVVILQPWQTDEMRTLKAANPGIKVLVYRNFSMTSSVSGYSSGVTYTEANTSHPDWFLLDSNGQRITSSGWSYLTLMDPGVQSYQQRWADNVISELNTQGWDGVFMDDVNATVKYHTSAKLAKYPTDADYQAAVRSGLAYIGPRVQAAGKLAVANIGAWSEYYSAGTDWLQFLSGAMDEQFEKWGTSTTDGYSTDWGAGGWATHLNMVKACESQGKLFLGITHSQSTDAAAARYGWATVLLAAGGHSSFALADDYTHETWFPEYDYDIGDPLAAETRDASGVHRRAFQHGLVLVNPTSSSQSVSFGGTYSGSGLTSATSTTMGPHTGLVLVGDSTSSGGTTSGGTTTGGTTDSGGTTTTTGGTTTGGTTDSGGTTTGGTTTGGHKGGKKKVLRSARLGRLSLLAGATDAGQVSLSWSRGSASRYEVYRDGRLVATVGRRSYLDTAGSDGSPHRYSVVGVDAWGQHRVRSRSVNVPAIQSSAASLVAVSRRRLVSVRASLASARRGSWKRIFVQARVRVGGRSVWRRVSSMKRPGRDTRFNLRVRRDAVVRLVVQSRRRGGRRLHSPALALRSLRSSSATPASRL